MKKLVSMLLCVLVMCGFFTGCASNNRKNDQSLSVVATTFPIYDWLRVITDTTDTEVTMLIDSGVDLHSFQPTVDDIVKISDCDMFVYIGGESDEWVEDALKEKPNADNASVNLMASLSEIVKEEEVVEGMEAEEEEEEEEEEEAPESDEHIWLSLKNASVICRFLCDKLCELDSENADRYKQNTEAYVTQLEALDAEYEQTVKNAKVTTLVFADRFPFRYLTDDYGLSYYAAFVGCSAETEASFETIVFLASKVDELGLNSLVKIETSDGAIAETVRENTKKKDQSIITLDSLQSTTKEDVENGVTYLEIMKENLANLKKVLENN